MYLTTREVIDLEEFAGLTVTHGLKEDELDSEFTIGADMRGIEISGDDSNVEKYRDAARCDGCDLNELQPLGEPMVTVDNITLK